MTSFTADQNTLSTPNTAGISLYVIMGLFLRLSEGGDQGKTGPKSFTM